MTADLTNPIFTDEDAARAHFEALRWPNGPVCPHCGAAEDATELKGKSTRPGVYKCRACKKPFTATIGTLYERSHIPLHKWLLATHLLCASKKGISAHQLFRMLGFGSYRTAWFMAHRIREAMRDRSLSPLGGDGRAVEADETYIGRKKGWKPQRGGAHKMKVLSLVERGGKVRSVRMDNVTADDVGKVVRANVARESRLMTDEARYYREVGAEMAGHESVNHSPEEWVRGEAHTNTLEGYFSVFKRGMKGIYQHCGEQRLHRYLAEFDFRYNERAALKISDAEGAAKATRAVAGKRLTYC